MLTIYNILIGFYCLLIRLVSPFSLKAKKWISGRQHIWQKLAHENIDTSRPLVWIHVASLGEFEQGRPIIEALKKQYPQITIFLSFFSPSGYEIRKNYQTADHVFYLPLDKRSNAQQFLNILQPQLILFVKYDLWYHYLNEAQQRGIPILLVSALFRPNQFFFQSYGRWMKKVIQKLEHIFVQNEASAKILENNQIQNFSIAGDTRVDRVAQQAAKTFHDPLVEAFIQQRFVLICGSTWSEDEKVLQTYINQSNAEQCFIIAPHDISEGRLHFIEQLTEVPSIRYSKATAETVSQFKVLIIDHIGSLSALYRYARLAYIGGAFGKGLHNTLEPISYGIPVIFGPKYQKFAEAIWLINNQAGFSVESSKDLIAILNRLEEEDFYKKVAETAASYISHNKGATQRVLDFIRDHKLLS